MSYYITEAKFWHELYLYKIFLILSRILFLLSIILIAFGKSLNVVKTWSQKGFLDLRPWSEGSYKIGSVRLSFRLSIYFLGIDSLVFSET